MTSFLTSYTYLGVELNDGANYLISTVGADFDSQNAASVEYAERQYATPFILGATLQPGEIPLSVTIVAKTPVEFNTKLEALKKLFDTSRRGTTPFYRKLPVEASYRSVDCVVTSFVPVRLERKVDITLSTEDRRWKAAAETVVTARLFDTLTTETLTITNAGFTEVEPVIVLAANEAPSGAIAAPQYWRHVAIYVYEAQHAFQSPLLLTSGWNTTALVAASHIRSDGADISVVTKGTGTLQPRYVGGSTADRKVWIRPTALPSRQNIVATAAMTNVQTTIPLYCGAGDPLLPTTGTVAFDNEIVSYTGVTYQSADKSNFTLTGVTRGYDGTTAVLHVAFTRCKQPYEFTIRYGYGAGYETLFSNQLTNWPPISYETSTNAEWQITHALSGDTNIGLPAPFYIGSAPYTGRRSRMGELAIGRSSSDVGDQDARGNTRAALYGGYVVASSAAPKLERLVFSVAGANRTVESIRVQTRMRANDGASGFAATSYLAVVRSQFNTQYEVADVLATQVHTSGVAGVQDTGYVNTDVRTKGGTHFVFDSVARTQPPIGSAFAQFVVPETISLRLDTTYGAAPLLGTLTSEYSVATGDFLIHVGIKNMTTGDEEFIINAVMRVGSTITIDADARSVADNKLTFASFTNATWLRLTPGANSVRFTTDTGAGYIDATITWRNRY